MQAFKRLWVVLFFSLIIFVPKVVSWACGPWPAPPEEYRLALLQPGMPDDNNEFRGYYFSMDRYYRSSDINDFVTQIETDQNYAEWKSELKVPFTKKHFAEAIQEYSYATCRDLAGELRKKNSFVNALLTDWSKDHYQYFLLAKRTENFNTVAVSQDPWRLQENAGADVVSLVHELENTLSQTQNKFIRQRTAYILCRVLFYGNRTEAFKKVYDRYFKNTASESWVKASAKYYYLKLANANDANTAAYYRGLTEVIDQSKDKRMACIKILNEAGRKNVLPHLTNKHQKATALASFAIRYPAYSLDDIKEIYALDPNNKFIALLITREINKLEDWLLTTALTDYKNSASKKYWLDSDHDWFQKQNLAKDRAYAESFKSFAATISAASPKDMNLMMDLCHINFLLKDLNAAQKCCETVLANADKNSTTYMQAKINSVLINSQQKQKLDESLKTGIYSLLVYLDNKIAPVNKREPGDDNTIKDQVLVYLGRSVLKMGDVANAALLLSGTFKPWGEFRTGEIKSAYFILLEHAKEKDFDAMVNILQKKDPSPFEKYFTKMKGSREGCNYTIYSPNLYAEANRHDAVHDYWNVNKVLDLEATYFLNKDSLEKALAIFKKIPARFWKDPTNVYANYLTGNPFNLNLYDPHEYNGDSLFVNDPDKAKFVEKLISYKRKAIEERDPETKARLNYYIGNAYYSMSYYGKFWLMSKLWWSSDKDDDDPNDPVNLLNYYSTDRAKLYYQKAFAGSKNAETAAFYCMYIANCDRNKKMFQSLEGKFNNDGKIIDNPADYTARLHEKPGSDLFFKRLIKECPLYSDFRERSWQKKRQFN